MRNVPPHNLEAETAVLGGVFLDNSIFYNLAEILDPEDFYSPAHQLIFSGFRELARKSQPLDMLTVTEELQKTGTLEKVGGRVYLVDLAESVISAANAAHHAQIVKEKSVQRQLIHVSTEIIQKCYDSSGEVEQLVDESQQSIFKISQSRQSRTYRSSRELVKEVFAQIEERANRQEIITGVPTDYTRFDELTAGLQPSDLVIVAGRPSMGKTAFALNVAMRAAVNHEVPTAVFSLEMSMEQLMQRMLCMYARADLKNLRTGFLQDDDWARLLDASDVLSRAPIFIDDTPAITSMELRSRCRKIKMEHNLGLIMVDYLQLMRASSRTDSREQEISEISRNLKALAKELHVPVVALSQLNRKVEDRSNRRPMLSDLRESGAIEQDADVICFIYRDEAYNPDTPKKNIAEIIIGKQRNGPTGLVELFFHGPSTSFENLSHDPGPSEMADLG